MTVYIEEEQLRKLNGLPSGEGIAFLARLYQERLTQAGIKEPKIGTVEKIASFCVDLIVAD